MVGNDTDGDIVLCVNAVLLVCDRANGVEYLSYGVNLEEVVNALHNASQTLKTHSCVYILL